MPPIVLQNWADEFEKWIPPQHRNDVYVYKFGKSTANELCINRFDLHVT
jgi:SNF2 family DNA or RNA helicase